MRTARLLLPVAVAAGVLAGTAAPADAHLVDVVTGTGGSCPAGYSEWAQLDQTTVCVHLFAPDAYLSVEGAPCRLGYTEYSLFTEYRVCVRWNH